MPTYRAVPIIVGVGDVKNKSNKIEDAIEPMQLMLDAIHLALADTNLPASARARLQSSVDSIDVVKTWTWPYPDLPGLLSNKLGIKPQHKFYSEHGGNKPVKLLDEAARRISQRESSVAIVTGGEAMASREHPQSSTVLECTNQVGYHSHRLRRCQKASSTRLDQAGAGRRRRLFAHKSRLGRQCVLSQSLRQR